MAKISRKRSQRPQKDQAGCMWGLMNMFDLRQGHSSTKLISDTKRGSGRHIGTKFLRTKLDSSNKFKDKQEVDDVDEGGEENINAAMTTIKTLVEEEISRTRPSKKIPIEEVDRICSELGLAVHFGKNHKQTDSKAVSDIVNDLNPPACLESQPSNCTSQADSTSPNFDLSALMIKFYDVIHQSPDNCMDYKSRMDLCPVSETVDRRKCIHLDAPDSKLSEKQVMLHNALVDVADVFLGQKSPNMELSGAVRSQEFIDALEILSTNKELLARLLQDPKLKQIQDRQNVQAGNKFHLESGNASRFVEAIGSSGRFEEPINQKLINKLSRYSLFRKMNKSKGRKQPMEGNDSRATSNIVILKPSPSSFRTTSITISPSSSPHSHDILKHREDGERVVSNFSLKEIKRRLRRVVSNSSKERDVISRDCVFHRVPLGSKVSGGPGNSASKTYYNVEYTSESSPSRRDKTMKPKNRQENMKNEQNSPMGRDDKRRNMIATAHPLNKKSFYEEAKEHLGQMLNTRHHNDISEIREISEPLGRLLSHRECNISPQSSSRRDKELDLSPTDQCKKDTSDHLRRLIPDSDATSCRGENSDDKTKIINASPKLNETQTEGICLSEDLKHRGSTEIVENGIIISQEEADWLDSNSNLDGNEPEIASTEVGSPEQSGIGPPGDGSPQTPCLSLSFDYLLTLNNVNPESILEKPERASPVSVLEPLFVEDVNRSGSELDMRSEYPLCSRSIHFEEHDNPAIIVALSDSEANQKTSANEIAGRFEYIRAVMELAGLSCEEISFIWLSSDKLLDPSLVDEVEISYELSDDPLLLFDCINEELVEIQERFFSCTPWVSFVKRNIRPIPVGENLIEEVCRGIERHLEWQSPRTLDQIIKKDMDGGTWIDLQSDIQSMVLEIGDVVLEELIVETALEMWI